MNDENNIFGCFICYPSLYHDATQQMKDLAKEQGDLFSAYIWGEKGISDALKKLKNTDYGRDLVLALFQFYVNPIPYHLQNLKDIEIYRKKEKSIGIPIIVNNENFFCKSEDERVNFLKHAILQKLNLLAAVVKRRKLDTKMELLKSDLQKVLN